MINNFEQIEKLLEFRSDDDFYFLQILQRKKENPDLPKSVKVINVYYIDSIDKLNRYKDRIMQECEMYKARAYINLNRRSYKKVALKTLAKSAELIAEEQYKALTHVYNGMCGSTSNESGNTKKWIIDIDFKPSNMYYILEVEDWLQYLLEDEDIYEKIPTPNGVHIIVPPFRMDLFRNRFPDIDVHKNNPTILCAYE